MSSLAEVTGRTSKLSRRVSANSHLWHDYSLYFEIFSHHAPLSISNRETLAELQQAPRRFKKGSVIKNHSLNAKYLLAIQDGWACSCRVTEEGKRQIIDLYLPGDIVGLRDYHTGGRFDEVTMLTDGLVIPMHKSQLDQAMQKDHSLVNAMLAATMHQCNIMADRLNNLISHDATTRLAYFILELHARLNFSRSEMRDLTIPLSQQVIGDLLGMTNVHVCRCLSQLEAKGLLTRDKDSRNIRLLDYPALLTLAGFHTAYLHSCSRTRQRAATASKSH
ncbi:Crp/Fnr family transcriptional regulator [Salinicola sp. MIT1003]|uniref:Crp/Fnr family transcriptional regulator n=1 Tax=Salinicola sp. MIT1003 TaxID=1882734 RepID=UPI0009F4ABE4|nr:Crp/Fnr family transcriptional regulator [Salinicola sp. MIT1003]